MNSSIGIGIVAALVVGAIVFDYTRKPTPLPVTELTTVKQSAMPSTGTPVVTSTPQPAPGIMPRTEKELQNLATYINSELSSLSSGLGVDYTHPAMKRPLRELFLDLAKAMKEGILKIRTSKELAIHTKLTVHLVPDKHIHMFDPSGDKEIVERQRLNQDWIERNRPTLAFVEGERNHRLDWESVYNDIVYQDDMKIERKISLKEFKAFVLTERAVWWKAYLEKKQPILFGMDDTRFNTTGMILDSIQESLRSQRLDSLMKYINFSFRDQIIMSNIVQTMIDQKETDAAMVIGASHALTMPALAKQWGINLIIEQ